MARVLVTNFHPGGGGGHVPYVQALTQMSDFRRHTIGVAVPASSRLYRYLRDSSYPFLYPCDFPAKLQKELPSMLRSIRKFKRIVSDFRPDIVHTNGAPDLFIAAWSHLRSSPYTIMRTHHRTKGIPTDPYHRWLYRRKVKANVYVSQAAFDLCTVRGLVPSDPCVIENGVDLERFRPISKDPTLAEKYGIGEGRLCFGSCAGTGAYKRIDTMIDAALQLKKEGLNNFTILVLGEESSGLALQELARRKGLEEFIYCGFHEDISPHVSLFDVGFILSDAIENMSFAAREMMAMGKPLISSSFSGLRENVQEGVNGFFVEPGNAHDVASAMRRFLKMDKEVLQAFSAKAREQAVNRFDIVKQKKAHDMLYQRIAKFRGGPEAVSINR